MEYKPAELEEILRVESMVTVHYFQFARGYVFSGERHDFWELVYMDKGEAEIGADGRRFVLGEGEAVMHKPGEFHSIWASGSRPPDIVVLSFVCKSPAMRGLSGMHVSVDDEGKGLIAGVIREASETWENKLGSNYLQLVRRAACPEGSAQMVRLWLEALLIRLLRRRHSAALAEITEKHIALPRGPVGRKEYAKVLVTEIEGWMSGHLGEKITINCLCSRFNISATSLKRVFRETAGGGVNGRLSRMRHEEAKRLIRDGRLSMKAIADRCGYGSVHYFSGKFTKEEGMTPSEYVKSVKGLANFRD